MTVTMLSQELGFRLKGMQREGIVARFPQIVQGIDSEQSVPP